MPSVSKRRVLLVHDDPEGLRYYSALLQDYGYLVQAFGSYAEGVHRLGSEVFDFIVVSQGSPSFEGRSVLERAMEIDRHLPVLVVARSLDMACYLQAMQLGAVDYLVEPTSTEDVARIVENHLPSRVEIVRAAGAGG